MDHLLAIRVFARVVEGGSFTKAADSMRMPKATVTKLVQDLERHLHVKLLQRTTRRVVVTAEGAAYYECTARVVNELDDIEAGLADAQVAPTGRLRIDVGSSFAGRVLIPALPEFVSRYPGIRIDLGVSDRPVDLVGENVDCVIRGGTLPDSSLVARRVGQMAWVTCATPGYLAAHGTPSHPRELVQGHALLGYASARTGRALPLQFARGAERIEIDTATHLTVNESSAHATSALTGIGLVQTLAFMVSEDLARGALVSVLAEWQPAPLPLHVVYPPNRYLGHRLRVFIDWVAGVCARVP
jgi:DNA-binding transcriptional LysR family regulator